MHPPVIGFVAYSGTGKTTLLEKLLPILRRAGLRVAIIKHTHHNVDLDQPGKDSYRMREAGARQVMVASAKRWALMQENEGERDEPSLEELLPHLDCENLDLILVEGFKHESFTKIELQRHNLDKPALYPDDPDIIAVASDRPEGMTAAIPVLDINQPEAIAEFIRQTVIDMGQCDNIG